MRPRRSFFVVHSLRSAASSHRARPAGAGFAAAVLLALALNACATAPPAPASSGSPDLDYLQGVASAYSARLDELPTTEELGPSTCMRNGLIAGDSTLYVAAALFRKGSFYTLDLIVLNHEDVAFELSRDAVHLVDDSGRWLSAVEDWWGASHAGLRGRMTPDASRVAYEMPEPYRDPEGLGAPSELRSTTPGSTKPSAPTPSQRSSSVGRDPLLRGPVGDSPQAPTAPARLSVAPHSSAPYWAYWRGDQVRYPLTAVIMLGDQQLLFRFRR